MSTDRFRTIDSLALFILDAFAIIASFYLAFQLRVQLPYPEPLAVMIPFETYYAMYTVQFVCILFALFLNRQYYVPRAPSRVRQLYQLFSSVTVGVLLTIALSTFFFKGESFLIDFPRAMVLYSWLLAIGLLFFTRIVHHTMRDWLRSRGAGQDRLLIVGTGDVAKLTLQRIEWSRRLGYHVVGIVDPDNAMRRLSGFPVLGAPEDLPRLIEKHNIDEVIIAMPEHGHRQVVKVVGYCQRGRVSIKIFPDVFQFITEQATIDDLGGLPLLTVRDFAMRGYMLVFKRLFDIFGSLAGLVLLSPALLLTAILVKLESNGPAFFVQERMGLDGELIQMIKFRSMRQDAEKSGPGWTVQNDPRRTRIGSFLRKVNLDEFPQLINVLLGEMSLVGPRPEQPYYVDQFRKEMPNYMQRHLLPSGMTGWAQVNGLRGDTSITERTKYDLWYIENWSLGLDITIIVRTIWMMLTNNNEGAG
ncbi:MAG: undecaprenyl-phosphate glucose phosphotransferase [Candidatus Promineifilaceae bacterium]